MAALQKYLNCLYSYSLNFSFSVPESAKKTATGFLLTNIDIKKKSFELHAVLKSSGMAFQMFLLLVGLTQILEGLPIK